MLGLSKQIGSLEPASVLICVEQQSAGEHPRHRRHPLRDGQRPPGDVDADMAEIGNHAAPAPEFYWQRHRDGRSFGIEYGPSARATARNRRCTSTDRATVSSRRPSCVIFESQP
jgi:hypothetical protein